MIVDIEIIEKYNDWKAQKGVASKDFSPQQFQIEYAKDLALERLTGVATYVQNALDEEPDNPEVGNMLADIKAIIEGKDV